MFQLRSIIYENFIHTIMKNFSGFRFNIGTCENNIHRMVDFCSHFFGFADQFESNRMDIAIYMVNIHADAFP
ncbi:hypothetical protein SDC9_190901 [bioreactor metagenome]|uniref:Uncharacterized protein n=1 Tax=bioreactor metagenome TaxID=1076179 RepID=A0A645HXW0_9ZZZZ